MKTNHRIATATILGLALTASLAQGQSKPTVAPPPPTPKVTPAPAPAPAIVPSTAPPYKPGIGTPPVQLGSFAGDYDFSGRAALSNPALMKEIDDTLIRAASCRSMAQLGYGNGYQCPAAGVPACMTMLKAGKVDACAKLDDRDYPKNCGTGEASSPEKRATSTCSDLSADLWASLAVRVPFIVARARLESYGCKAEAGTTIFCKSHIRERSCQPFERAGVVVCRPPKLVKRCGDVGCTLEET